MRLTNRELKREAKKTHKKILEEDKEWYEKIRAERYGCRTTQKKGFFKLPKKAIWGLASSFIIIIAVTVSLLVILLPEENDTRKRYFSENEATKISDLSSVNNDLMSTIIQLDSLIINKVNLVYDYPTNDALYYGITANDEDNFWSARFHIIVNKDYSHNFHEDLEHKKTSEINGFIVDYKQTALEFDGLFSIECRAILTTDHEIYFIEYTAWSIDEEGIFLEWLEQTIIAK